jgi:multidrug efflux pump subunit AcrA (membrane-fusion protein)
MPRHRIAAFAGLLAALAVAGCRGEKAAPPPATPKVTVARPATAPVRDFLLYNGNLDTIDSVEVRARVKGILTNRYFTEGMEVTGKIKWINGETLYPGDLLYQIDKREYLTARAKAEAEVAQAKADIEKSRADVRNWEAQIELATAELKRVEDAVRRGVASTNDLDKAKATLDVNKAQLAAARAHVTASESARDSAASALRTAEIQLGYTDIRAEISGQIGRTAVTEGNLVGQNETTLLTGIIRVDKLYAMFDVPEKDVMEYLHDAEKYNLPIPPRGKIPMALRVPGNEGEWHAGEIDYVEGKVNTGTGTVRARAVVPNPRRAEWGWFGPPQTDARLFVPGMYVQVRMPRGPELPRLCLPEDAIMTGQEGRFVYVVGSQGLVEKRVVTVGPVVWKAPPLPPGVAVPMWALVNPKPPPPPEKGPPAPTRRPVYSVVAVMANLKPDDRVIVDGVQKARPGSPVAAEEWVMQPPAK